MPKDTSLGARASRIALAALLLAAGLLFLDGSRERRPPDARSGAAARSTVPDGVARAPAGPDGGVSRSAVGGAVAGEKPAAAPSFDLGAVMEQVHFAWRPQVGGWSGGHTTYAVALGPDGALEVVPYHHPDGRPSGTEPPARRARVREERAARAPATAEAAVEGDGVRLAPSSAARGGEVIASGAGEARTGAKGQLEIAKGALTEQLRNGPEGVEQSWRFAAPPGGSGDLEVRVALAGGAFVGQSEAGLHFSGGKLGVRYGHATWIDALGMETAVPARWDGSAIVLRVPAAIVDGSVYPAVLDPIISPELSMDEPVYGSPWSDQSAPKLTSNGVDWFVVWQDYRRLGSDVFGARVSGTGAVLDPEGIAISQAAASEYEPAVAWNGTHYLVGWQAQGVGILGARVSGTGGLVDAAPLTISPTGAGAAIAAGGTQFLVTWYDGRNGTNDLFCARVTGEAVVLDPGGVPVSTAAYAQVYPAVAWNGTDWLVVWHDYRTSANDTDVYGARVSGTDGTVLDPSGIAISVRSGYQSDTAVAWDGTNFTVVWRDSRNRATSDDIYGARVSGAGTILDADGFAISTASNIQSDPAIAWNGTQHLVVWLDPRTSGNSKVYGARVTSEGSVLDPSGIAISLTAYGPWRPAVAANGATFLAVWEDWRNNGKDVYGARVSDAAGPLDASDFLVSQSANAQHTPSVAWDGTNYLAVWQDERSGTYSDIYGARLSGVDGALLDASGIAISTAANDQWVPAVAWNGSNYLVVWEDERNSTSYADIYGARVSAAGVVLEATGIGISTGVNDMAQPAVASDGKDFFVAWDEARGAPTYTDILGARVSGEGTVVDTTPIVIKAGTLGEWAPALSWDGTNYLVVWYESRSVTYFDILGARVSGAGAVLDSPAIVISAATSDQSRPDVTWDGGNHLVVWQDHRSGPTGVSGTWDIYGARVSAAGSVLDPSGIAISTEAGDQNYPAVASDGTRFLVAWQDLRSGTFSDLYAAQVTPSGEAPDAGGFLVSGSSLDERGAAVVSPGPNRFLVAYSAFDAAPEMSAWRVKARSVVFSATLVANAQSVTLGEDASTAVTLTATDPEGAPLTFDVVTQPAHGTLTGTAPDLTYTPAADYHGADGFTFKANDGGADSNVATVSITVTPVNDAPVAQAQSVTVGEGASVPVTLAGTDADGDAMTYAIVMAPAHGTLSGTGAEFTYTAAVGYAGADAFTFVANDGTVDSAEATVSITVTAHDEPAGEPAGGCGCATSGDVAPLGALLLGTLGLRRRRVAGSAAKA